MFYWTLHKRNSSSCLLHVASWENNLVKIEDLRRICSDTTANIVLDYFYLYAHTRFLPLPFVVKSQSRHVIAKLKTAWKKFHYDAKAEKNFVHICLEWEVTWWQCGEKGRGNDELKIYISHIISTNPQKNKRNKYFKWNYFSLSQVHVSEVSVKVSNIKRSRESFCFL